jgi:rhodanese-related sulfurtransferase
MSHVPGTRPEPDGFPYEDNKSYRQYGEPNREALVMFPHQSPVPAIDAAQVPDGGYLLDVREPVEWQAGHAPGAHHIPLGELPYRADEVPQDCQVHVICKVGGRSAQAAQVLNANGWDTVNVDGGMMAWAAAGRPMVSEDGQPPEVV